VTTLVVFGGLPGVGKTTIAGRLAAETGAVFLRIDVIEMALHDAGVDVQAEGYAVAYGLAASNLKLGLDVIADCVNPVPETREAWRAVAERAGARLVEVEVVCSDAAEHRRRVETRVTDLPGFVPPTWQEVEGRDYRPWDRERLVIDTAVTDADAAVALIRGLLPVSRQGHR
jgi:predicted kinase